LELLPAVKKSSDDWLIVADASVAANKSPSETDRQPSNLAEVLQMALREATESPDRHPISSSAANQLPGKDAFWVRTPGGSGDPDPP